MNKITSIFLFIFLLLNIIANAQTPCKIIGKIYHQPDSIEYIFDLDINLINSLVDNDCIGLSPNKEIIQDDIVITKWIKKKTDRHCCFDEPPCTVWDIVEGTATKGDKLLMYERHLNKGSGKFKLDFYKNHLEEKRVKLEIEVEVCKGDVILYQTKKSNGIYTALRAAKSKDDLITIIHDWQLPEKRDTTLYWEKMKIKSRNGERVIQYVIPFSDEDHIFDENAGKYDNEMVSSKLSLVSLTARGYKMKGYYKGSILEEELTPELRAIWTEIHMEHGLPIGNIPNFKPMCLILGLHGFMNEDWYEFIIKI